MRFLDQGPPLGSISGVICSTLILLCMRNEKGAALAVPFGLCCSTSIVSSWPKLNAQCGEFLLTQVPGEDLGIRHLHFSCTALGQFDNVGFTQKQESS